MLSDGGYLFRYSLAVFCQQVVPPDGLHHDFPKLLLAVIARRICNVGKGVEKLLLCIQ